MYTKSSTFAHFCGFEYFVSMAWHWMPLYWSRNNQQMGSLFSPIDSSSCDPVEISETAKPIYEGVFACQAKLKLKHDIAGRKAGTLLDDKYASVLFINTVRTAFIRSPTSTTPASELAISFFLTPAEFMNPIESGTLRHVRIKRPSPMEFDPELYVPESIPKPCDVNVMDSATLSLFKLEGLQINPIICGKSFISEDQGPHGCAKKMIECFKLLLSCEVWIAYSTAMMEKYQSHKCKRIYNVWKAIHDHMITL